MDDDPNMWNFLHGTGAGCASIMMWEMLKEILVGGALFGVYAVATVGIVHVVRLHRKHLKISAQKGKP